MPFTEDLSAFLAVGDFAIASTHGGSTKYVIFERQFVDQGGVQGSAPTALGRKSDFTTVAREDSIVISGTTWKVKEFLHDPPDFPDMTLMRLGTS